MLTNDYNFISNDSYLPFYLQVLSWQYEQEEEYCMLLTKKESLKLPR